MVYSGVLPAVGKIFGTSPLPFTLMITSLGFGVGSLLVGVILKLTPAEFVDKFSKLELDENGSLEGTDIISRTFNKISEQFKRGETEKLIDSK